MAHPRLAFALPYLRTIHSSRPGVYRCVRLLSVGETGPRATHEFGGIGGRSSDGRLTSGVRSS